MKSAVEATSPPATQLKAQLAVPTADAGVESGRHGNALTSASHTPHNQDDPIIHKHGITDRLTAHAQMHKLEPCYGCPSVYLCLLLVSSSLTAAHAWETARCQILLGLWLLLHQLLNFNSCGSAVTSRACEGLMR